MRGAYDVVVVGLGPAGMAAGIYAARRRLATLVVGRSPGGKAATAHLIENYPGVLPTTGLELARRMEEHLRGFEVDVEVDEVVGVERRGRVGRGGGRPSAFSVRMSSGRECSATALVLATGTEVQGLGVPGERELSGRGVSYCATCDGPLFRGRSVVVVGSGNRAADAALLLAENAGSVTLLSSGRLLADESLAERLAPMRVAVREGARLARILGERSVTGVEVEGPSGPERIAADGVFVEEGEVPATGLAASLGAAIDRSFIVVDGRQRTSVPGLFAAGDVTGGWAQVVVACAQGAMAAAEAAGHVRRAAATDGKGARGAKGARGGDA